MNNFLTEDLDLIGKKVLVRAGLNVPIDEKGNIENNFRLKAILPTLKFLINKKAKIILIGHIGRDKKQSLKKVFKYFKKKEKLGIKFNEKTFVDFDIKKIKKEVDNVKDGEVLLLDNLRATAEEKNNSEDFKNHLKSLADIYINEAFSVSHREHASIAVAEKFVEKYLGLQFEKELEFLDKIKNIENKEKSIFILGGSKIKTKLPLLDELSKKFGKVILGGVIANNFYKFLGYEIGKSLYDNDEMDLQKYLDLDNLFIPNIVIVQNKKGRVEKEISEVDKDDTILDISPTSFLELEDNLREAEAVFFNGPVGFYEGGFTDGTSFLLSILANKDNLFIAGGGNTASAIYEIGLENNVDFISTGGGSLIEYISRNKLFALEQYKK